MPWNAVIDQCRVIESLRSNIASDRVAHAYLFHGPNGVGKRAVAIEFARALLCEKGGDEACGECLACTKVGKMVHPDLHVLLPDLKDPDPAEIADRLRRLGLNPYATIDFVRRPSLDDPSKASNIQAIYRVDRIREDFHRVMRFKPVEGRYKIMVITDADALNPAASNAFLKLLEEPPDRSIFLLTTSRPDRLLPTILSRCRHVRFEPLPPDAVKAALIAREKVDARHAATVARLADGSYSEALDLLENEELMAIRLRVLEYFRYSYVNDIDRISDLVEDFARLSREQVKNVLDLMLRWVRDLILYRALGEEAALVNVDQKKTISDFTRGVPEADLEAMVSVIEEAVRLVERNVQVNLTLTVLSQALRKAMRGRHDGRLYVPLAEAESA